MSFGSEHDFFPSYKGYARFAGPDSVMPWRFESIGVVGRPAQAADGTIYAVERYDTGLTNPNPYGSPIVDTQIVVLDGATGAVRKRIPLARERHQSPCINGRQTVPQIEGPIVGTDGYGYLVVRNYTRMYTDPGGPGCSITHITQDMGLTLLRIAPSGATSATTVYSQHCEGPIGSTACDESPTIYEVFPDGIGGTLVRAFRTTAPGEQEMRLTRVTDQGVQYDIAVDFDERIHLIGDNGTAFVVGDAVGAKDVTDWTAKWTTPNLSGNFVAALPNGGLAVHDSTTASLVELDASGTPVQAAALSSFGYQNSFGAWTTTGPGQVSVQFSLPLNEATTSFAFVGDGTRQNAVRERFTAATRQQAALDALEFIFTEPLASGAAKFEYGGLICKDGQQFRWSEIRTDKMQETVAVPDTLCPPGMIAAHFHTHPPLESPVPSGNDRSDLNPPQPLGGDYYNALTHPGVPYYLRAPIPNSPVNPPKDTHILKYWWTGTGAVPSQNVCKRSANGSWAPYAELSPNANCMTPNP